MSDRFVVALLLVLIVAFILIAVRWIVKLPSRYDRKPRVQTPWNSLDNGIDPSISEKTQP
ncbi:MAG: hypothetical protein WDO06_09765 [Actinomycetota bacterium]